MKRIFLAVLAVLMFSQVGFCEDVWSYFPKTVNKIGDKVFIRVEICFNGEERYGREIGLDWEVIKNFSILELRNALTERVQYIIAQENLDHLIKERLKPYLNTEIIVP